MEEDEEWFLLFESFVCPVGRVFWVVCLFGYVSRNSIRCHTAEQAMDVRGIGD